MTQLGAMEMLFGGVCCLLAVGGIIVGLVLLGRRRKDTPRSP